LIDSCENRARFSCPFHGWTFDLNGKLIGLPDPDSFSDVDRASRSLVRVPIGEANGLIFIIPDANADTMCIEDYLGEFGTKLDYLELTSARLIKTERIETNANWKYVLDTYEESYHNAVLHPDSFGRNYHNFIVYDKFGLHQRVNFVQRTYDSLIGKEESEWPLRPYGGLHFIFPNTIVNRDTQAAGDRTLVVRVYPIGPDRCATYFSTYVTGESSFTDQEHLAVHDLTVRIVTTEDYSVSEDGQRNLQQAPLGFTTVFGRNEVALQEFHRNIARAVGE
jgi:phenylpropionate dioxygenase-like ring-hydroxylating dioxygenase large terminal subunit